MLIKILFYNLGGIACGKTSVCEVFQKYDIPVINADLISRQSK